MVPLNAVLADTGTICNQTGAKWFWILRKSQSNSFLVQDPLFDDKEQVSVSGTNDKEMSVEGMPGDLG